MRPRQVTAVALALLAAAALLGMVSPPAHAQPGYGGGGADFVDSVLAAEAGIELSSPDGAEIRPGAGTLAGSDTPPPPSCWYQPGHSSFSLIQLVDRIWRASRRESEPIPSLIEDWRTAWLTRIGAHAGEDGLWFYTKCSDWSAIHPFRLANPDPFIWVPTGGPIPPVAGVVITPEQLAQYARDSVVLPDTAVEMNPVARSTVNLDTWVWLDPAVFRPLRVRAQAGPLTVDAVAAPARLLLPRDLPADLMPRDGECTDLYRTYRPGDAPACAITFGHSSARESDLAFDADFAVVWEVTWTSNWGVGGTLPDGQFAITTQIPVQEIQTIVTGSD